MRWKREGVQGVFLGRGGQKIGQNATWGSGVLLKSTNVVNCPLPLPSPWALPAKPGPWALRSVNWFFVGREKGKRGCGGGGGGIFFLVCCGLCVCAHTVGACGARSRTSHRSRRNWLSTTNVEIFNWVNWNRTMTSPRTWSSMELWVNFCEIHLGIGILETKWWQSCRFSRKIFEQKIYVIRVSKFNHSYDPSCSKSRTSLCTIRNVDFTSKSFEHFRAFMWMWNSVSFVTVRQMDDESNSSKVRVESLTTHCCFRWWKDNALLTT